MGSVGGMTEPKPLPPLPLRTERLVLRRFEAADLDAFHAYHSLPETARFLPGEAKSLHPVDGDRGPVRQLRVREGGRLGGAGHRGRGFTRAARRGGAQVAGRARAGRDRLEPGAGGPRGRGIASGGRRALLKLGFEDLGFHRIDAKLDALNTASAALCERLGMRLESRQVDKWHYKGEWATEVVYAILADEWKARQQVSGR